LWVSQFTLAAELESGYRPSYSKAMDSNIARERFRLFCESVKAQAIPGLSMIFGDFGQEMSLRYTNWGPLSILLNRDEKGVERVHV
jgi:D-Tyr-tRNAtyr deacylase